MARRNIEVPLSKVDWLLRHTNKNVLEIAQMLGISYNTLARRLKELDKCQGRCLANTADIVANETDIVAALNALDSPDANQQPPTAT